MVERQEVEALLAEVHSMAEINQVAVGDIAHPVEGDTLAALCRAWLALQDAPEVCVGKSAVMGAGWQIYGTDGDNIESLPFKDGQRVRIVKEPVE